MNLNREKDLTALYPAILRPCIERRTILLWFKVAVTVYLGIRVHLAQIDEQIQQGRLLLECSSVFRFQLVVGHSWFVLQSTDVGNTNAVGVVATSRTVSTNDVNISALHNFSVTIYQVVIPDVAPALFLMVSSTLLNCIVPALWCGCAMNNYLLDNSLRLLETTWNQLCHRCRPDNAVWLQSVSTLVCPDCFLGDFSVDSIWAKIQSFLNLLDNFSAASALI